VQKDSKKDNAHSYGQRIKNGNAHGNRSAEVETCSHVSTELLNGAIERYRKIFSRESRISATAPARVNLVGEPRDYINDLAESIKSE
jgi:hypothetical protein